MSTRTTCRLCRADRRPVRRAGRWHSGLLVWVIPLVGVAPAVATDAGNVAAARVSQSSYRHFLDDLLYTHEGDDRGFGPEHDLARDNIAEAFTLFGLTVTLEPFVYEGETYHNVVGTKLGSTFANQEYIVGAHYDSWYAGADDNASGVSLLLETARILGDYDSDYTIRLIAFDREEQGLVGSRAYVAAHAGDDVLAMISADMIAYNLGTNLVDLWSGDASIPLKEALAVSINRYGQGLASTINGPLNGSDHHPFELEGFQACLLIEDWGNPNYHRSGDHIDQPDYLDYAFATRVTRSVIGFLVDHAGVAVEGRADTDADGDVDDDDFARFVECYGGRNTPPADPECNLLDFDLDGDVDCSDWTAFRAAWTGPGDLPVFWTCNLLSPIALGAGARCLTISPPQHPLPMALQVSGSRLDAAVSCVRHYVQADGRLGAGPVFRMADEWGTVLVCAEDFVPGTLYEVRCNYGTPTSSLFSRAAGGRTSLFGDTVGFFNGTEWPEPDGRVDIIDIVAVLEAFAQLPTAPPVNRVDIVGLSKSGLECWPDQRIDMVDVLAAAKAFGMHTYWEVTGCPRPCP